MLTRVALIYALLSLAPWASGQERDKDRASVVRIAGALVGTKEDGVNRGALVEKILASVGLPAGEPWCAAFNYFVFCQAGFGAIVPKSGWSPDWLKGGRRSGSAYPADVFGIFFRSKGRIAHTGIVERQNGPWVTTIEGNASSPESQDSREGDGVWRKKRSVKSLVLKTYL